MTLLFVIILNAKFFLMLKKIIDSYKYTFILQTQAILVDKVKDIRSIMPEGLHVRGFKEYQ